MIGRTTLASLLAPSMVALGALAGPLRAGECDTWQPVGGGTAETVLALTTYNGELIAGGNFSTAGGTTVNHIARWNPTDGWRALSSGQFFHGTNDPVHSLTTFNGQLVAGGAFSNAGNGGAQRIAMWSQPGGWLPLGNGLTGSQPTVHALTVYNGSLIAGGSFSGSGQGGPALNRVAQWTGGSWSQLSSGLNSTVYALTPFNNLLIAGGAFSMTPPGGSNQSVNGVAGWDGFMWHDMGFGLVQPVVYALIIHDGVLYAGGQFTLEDSPTAANVARWNSAISRWEPLAGGANGPVRAMTVFNGDLIVAGHFNMVGGIAAVSANHIARFNGSTWTPLDSGVTGTGPVTSVYALASSDADLVAGGSFAVAANQDVHNLANWQSCQTQPCVGDIAPTGGDGLVNIDDLVQVIVSWGPCGRPSPCPSTADVYPYPTGDGVVNIDDLVLVVTSWGGCP